MWRVSHALLRVQYRNWPLLRWPVGARHVICHVKLRHWHGSMHVAETGSSGRDTTGDAGHVYASLVATRLAEEEVRHGSLQARGLAVVTTSGTLVALIFA